MIQLASDAGNTTGLVFFLFDLLYLDGEDLTARPLIERKERLAGLLSSTGSPLHTLHYSDHQIGYGPTFYEKACTLGVEGIVSKSRKAPTRYMSPAIAACGAKSNVCTARNSW
jgi:bifunctional non-homologous end joining protein LigD